VQRVDLGPALAPLLMADTIGEIEQRREALLQFGVAFDLAADVANDAAEPGAQKFERAPGALELMGVGNNLALAQNLRGSRQFLV
jgi:hypothetical protein